MPENMPFMCHCPLYATVPCQWVRVPDSKNRFVLQLRTEPSFFPVISFFARFFLHSGRLSPSRVSSRKIGRKRILIPTTGRKQRRFDVYISLFFFFSTLQIRHNVEPKSRGLCDASFDFNTDAHGDSLIAVCCSLSRVSTEWCSR